MSEQPSLLSGRTKRPLRMTGCGLPLGSSCRKPRGQTDRRNCRMNIVDINFDYLNANLV